MKFNLIKVAFVVAATTGFTQSALAAYYTTLIVYNPDNTVAASVTGDLITDPATPIYIAGIAVDVSRYGDFSTVFDTGTGHYVNIFGIATGGPDEFNLGLSGSYFASLPSAHVYNYTGLPIEATDYLSSDLRARGFTAFVTTDGAVPEPASWAMMISGMGAIGFAMRGRRKLRIAFA